MNELKPCPFCGSTTSLEMSESNYPNDKYVVCNFNKGGCGGSTGSGDSDEEAIQKWNRREAQRWIPVSERLPKENGTYWICDKYGDVTDLSFIDGEFVWNDVTHWMPLPTAPTGDQQ